MKTKAILATLLVAAAVSADARFAWPYPRKAVSPDEIGHSMKTNAIAQDPGWDFSFWFAISSPLLGVLLGILAAAIFCR